MSVFLFQFHISLYCIKCCVVLLQKLRVQQHMTRSLSVPVNIKVRSLRRTESGGGLIRVISATPRTEAVERTLVNNVVLTDIGKY